MVVIAGSFDQDQVGMGGFQEWDQVRERTILIVSQINCNQNYELSEALNYRFMKILYTNANIN